MNGKYKGLEDRAGGTYCVPRLQEAVSELILPSATGKSVPAGFHLLQEDNSGLHSLQGGRRGWSRDWNPWHISCLVLGKDLFSLVGGQAEPLRSWGQGQSDTR